MFMHCILVYLVCSMPHLAGIAGTKLHLNTRAPKDVLRDSKGSRSHIMTKIPTPLEVSQCMH